MRKGKDSVDHSAPFFYLFSKYYYNNYFFETTALKNKLRFEICKGPCSWIQLPEVDI
jgi:hypothetical protein